MPKYRFRKMYFICKNKRVIESNVWSTDAYQGKHHAESIMEQKDKTVYMWMENDPPIEYSVEGFYLVHESLFEAILKEYSK